MVGIGTAEYVVEVSGLLLPKLKIPSPQPWIREIFLEKPEDGQLSVEFSLIDVFDGDEAKSMMQPVLGSILNYIAFEYSISVGEPRLSSLELPRDESGSVRHLETSFVLPPLTAGLRYTPDDDERKKISAAANQLLEPSDIYALFRFALHQADPVSRFMFLYNILLTLHEDYQPTVDNFIQQEEPDVEVTPSPHVSGREETVYTKLRNEVSHNRSDTTPSQTREAIIGNVNKLRRLVRKAIALQT